MSQIATTARSSTQIRKAAILIATLDTATADKLLDKMPAEQAAQVRQAVMELDDIVPDEQNHVIREFIGADGVAAAQEGSGVELDAALAQKIRWPGSYDHLQAPSQPPAIPFQLLCEASAEALVRQLERQHPQAIALVIAHFPPQRAAAVVERFAPPLQADVLRRVAELGPADPEVIREVEQELEQLLHSEIRAARHRRTGLSTVAAIVNAAGTRRQSLIGNLERHSREFASQLEEVVAPAAGDRAEAALPMTAPASPSVLPPRERPSLDRVGASQRPESDAEPVSSPAGQDSSRLPRSPDPGPVTPGESRGGPTIAFEDLSHLGNDDWVVLIREVEPRILLLSLAGASEAFLARMAGQLPRQEAKQFRRRLEQVGPVQLADIDRAQHHVLERARELAAQGVLRFPPRKSFTAAA